MSPAGSDGLAIRRATEADQPAVLALLGAALGWGDDQRFADFFAWKHRENPFGPSPSWVAVDGEKVVGFRTFLRWELEGPNGTVQAVRAVDTATHPDYQRRGIFSRLTSQALDELAAEGVDLVFNTPNDRSGPGYLKLGWSSIGRLTVTARVRKVASLARLASAAGPAERWSRPCANGLDASAAMRDPGLTDLLSSQPEATALRTRRTPPFLAWRYGFAPLRYRVVVLGDGLRSGFAVFRVRRRGRAVEASVSEVIVCNDETSLRRSALRQVVAAANTDYVLTLHDPSAWKIGFVPVPRQGPHLVARPLAKMTVPARSGWSLSLGDVELF